MIDDRVPPFAHVGLPLLDGRGNNGATRFDGRQWEMHLVVARVFSLGRDLFSEPLGNGF